MTRSARRGASRCVRLAFKGELLAFRWGAWAARTRRPRTQRQLILNARERLRLVATEARAYTKRRHPPSPSVVAGIGAAAGRTTSTAEAPLLFIREE